MKKGFSLIEVLLSLGIMSVALLLVFAIITPLISKTGDVSETAVVNRLTDRIKAEVEGLPFEVLKDALISEADSESSSIQLFASRDGSKLLLAPESAQSANEIFFTIELSGNDDISPASPEDPSFLIFQIRISQTTQSQIETDPEPTVDTTLAVFNSIVIHPDFR